LALALAVGAVSCGREASHPDILLVTIDTVRADRLGAYGDHLAMTPSIDALARRGQSFVRASCQAPITLPSHCSMLTGTYPTYHGVRKNGEFALDPAFDSLAEILHGAGYRTAAFVSAFCLNRRFGLAQGFEVYDDVGASGADSAAHGADGGVAQHARAQSLEPERRAADTVDRALEWLARAPSSDPVFLWVHLYDPHSPYDPPEPYRTLFTGAQYRGEIATMDREIGRLIDAFDARRPGIIVLASDHGEGLGGHGEMTHGYLVYEETMRVPLVIAAPERLPAGVIRWDAAETVDIMPTLLGFAGVAWSGQVQGHDLASAPADSLGYGETLYGELTFGWSDLRVARAGDWKYIKGGAPELFDLDSDPGETANRAHDETARVSAFEEQLGGVIATKPDLPAAPGRVALTDEETAALGALGYVGAARAGADFATLDDDIGEGIDPREGMRALLAFERMDSLFAWDEVDSAIDVARAIAADPNAGEPIRARVPAVLLSRGQPRAAREVSESLHRALPDDAQPLVTLAGACIALRDFAAARSAIDRARSLDPDNATAAIILGRVLMAEGRSDSAESVLERALATHPRERGLLLLLAQAQIDRDHVEAAHATLSALSTQNPGDREAKRLLIDLEAKYPELARLRDAAPERTRRR
jgi:arylsulfatase A-like enzyme